MFFDMKHRKLTTTFLVTTALGVMLLGCLGFFFIDLDESVIQKRAHVLEGVVVILLGLGLLFLAIRRFWIAFCIGVLAFVCEVVRVTWVAPRLLAYLEAAFDSAESLRQAFAPYLWFNLSIVLLACLGLLCATIRKWKEVWCWISSLFVGAAFGLLFVALGAFLADITDLFLWQDLFVLSWIDCLALLIFLFGVGIHILRELRRQSVTWLACMVAVVCFGATLSSWAAFNVREKNFVFEEELDRAQLLIHEISFEGRLYFEALERYSQRWGRGEANRELHHFDGQNYLKGFGFLKQIAVFDSSNHLIFEVSDGIHQRTVSEMERLIESKEVFPIYPQTGGLRGAIILKEEKPFLVNTYALPDKSTIYYIADFEAFMDELIVPGGRGHYGYQIFLEKHKIYELEGIDLTCKQDFGIRVSWEFFGLPFFLEYWPQKVITSNVESAAGVYHLLIGSVFSLVLALCVYFMIMAIKKRREAEALNLEKNFFIANISHELRTPLHGIVGALSILDTIQMGEEERHWFEGLRRESRALHSLINELIDLSEMELVGASLVMSNVDLMLITSHLHSKFAELAKQKNLGCVFEYQEDLPRVFWGDNQRLRQILTNLLSNAVNFTNEGSIALKIKGAYAKDRLYDIQLIVSDTGIGIEKSQHRLIFEKYKHMEVRNTRGSGLGLAIVQRLVNAMDGWIQVESVVGKGSEFTVHLKLEAVDNENKEKRDD